MDTPNQRLKRARIRAGYATGREAAAALGVKESTYLSHENGSRGFPASRAPDYARKYRVTEEWLLYGKGDEPVDPIPSEAVLQEMVREALDAEVTMETKRADLPRIIGSNLRTQLERFASDPAVVSFWAEKSARDEAARSRAATKEDDQAGSRSA